MTNFNHQPHLYMIYYLHPTPHLNIYIYTHSRSPSSSFVDTQIESLINSHVISLIPYLIMEHSSSTIVEHPKFAFVNPTHTNISYTSNTNIDIPSTSNTQPLHDVPSSSHTKELDFSIPTHSQSSETFFDDVNFDDKDVHLTKLYTKLSIVPSKAQLTLMLKEVVEECNFSFEKIA